MTHVYGVYDRDGDLCGAFSSEKSLIKIQEEYGGEFISNYSETGKTVLKMYGSFRVKNHSMHVYVNSGYILVEAE